MFTYFGKTQASMLIGDFKVKLRKLHRDLYIRDEVRQMDGLKHSGIYLKMQKQAGLSYNADQFAHETQLRYGKALESGHLDKYLCGVCIEWIPEYDVFNAEYTKIAVPGWRTLAIRLSTTGLFSLEQARKVFNCKGLGQSDYDKQSFFNKLQFAKKIDQVTEG